MTERVKFNASVSFIIKQDAQILLFYRTDGYFKDGWWVLPAGYVEEGETATVAVIRECKEELNIDVSASNVKFAHVVYNLSGENKRMNFYFYVQDYDGILCNLEPDKCEKMQFFALNQLPPADKIAPTTLLALQNIEKNIPYSERK